MAKNSNKNIFANKQKFSRRDGCDASLLYRSQGYNHGPGLNVCVVTLENGNQVEAAYDNEGHVIGEPARAAGEERPTDIVVAPPRNRAWLIVPEGRATNIALCDDMRTFERMKRDYQISLVPYMVVEIDAEVKGQHHKITNASPVA